VGQVRFRDLLALIARAADVGMGQPDDHSLRAALVAHGTAEAGGLTPREVRDAVFLSLLRFSGCTAESHLAAKVFGDEIAFRGAMYGQLNFGEPREVLAFVWKMSGRGRGLPGRAAAFARTVAQMPGLMEASFAHCEVNDIFADRLGLDQRLRDQLGQVYEAWNGTGVPNKLKGEAIFPAVRVVGVADEVESAHRLAGLDGAVAIARRRAGRVLDPATCQTFIANAETICGPLAAASPAKELAALSLADEPPVDEKTLDALCEILADFTDLKCESTRGHSTGVADLAVRAAALLRLPTEIRTTLRRAALLHDLGRVSVSAAIWDKRGSLTDAESARVQSHTIATERILGDAPMLAAETELASLAHERIDGRGYHRRLPAVGLPVAARVLAAADVYQALRSNRPHRAALSTERAVAVLREEAQAGRLDGQAVEAVLAAAGERPAVRAQAPAGLTEREVEVLRLLARGLTNREIAGELKIAVKTAGNHVQSTLDKIGVRTRSAAAMFAMRHGLAS
jgi:HD-GYP domain-containing protein (c-di-GMP phosphodiesterase class II)